MTTIRSDPSFVFMCYMLENMSLSSKTYLCMYIQHTYEGTPALFFTGYRYIMALISHDPALSSKTSHIGHYY